MRGKNEKKINVAKRKYYQQNNQRIEVKYTIVHHQ